MNYTIAGNGFFLHHRLTETPDAQNFTRHAHGEYEILYFLQGTADCVFEHQRHTMQPGEIVLIPSLAYHFVALSGSTAYERVVLDFSECGVPEDLLKKLFEQPRVYSTESLTEIKNVFERMDSYAHQFSGDTAVALARCLTAELLYLLDTIPLMPTQKFTKFSHTMEDVLRYIDEHLATINGLDELCSHLYVSRAYLHRVFIDSLGISPMRYITSKRLWLAQNRLQLGEKPTQVCISCGFHDYSAFYRAYKSFFGISPGEERQGGKRQTNFL